MSETIIDLIRHGEPEGGRKYRGHNIDDALGEKGWRQMWDAIGEQHPWQVIASSPLRRCCEFAEALAERYGIPVLIDERFKEIGFGTWEGKTRQEIRRQNLKEYQDFYDDPVNCRPAGAENLDGFIVRTTSAFDEMVQQYAGQHCLLVAHAGVIRAIIARALHADPAGLYRIEISTAGLSRIVYGSNSIKLAFVNRPFLPN